MADASAIYECPHWELHKRRIPKIIYLDNRKIQFQVVRSRDKEIWHRTNV
jgi:hypothetical protein